MVFANLARNLRARRATRTFFLSSARLGVLCALCVSLAPVRADTFGSGANQFEIEFVPIGAVGNPADTTGSPNPAGSVDYFYRMGKYEISESMIDAANALTENSDNPLNITHDGRGPNKPATRVSWFEAARFVNWLNTSEGYLPAYKFDDQNEFQLWEPTDNGYDAENLFRNRRSRYFLPSADEWYKAAFYDPAEGVWWDYPNGSSEPPVPVASGSDPNTAVWNQETGPADIVLAGGQSPFGTVGQGGNVWEREETEFDLVNNLLTGGRGLRGSDWGLTITDFGLSSSFRTQSLPERQAVNTGFRVASIPEPSSFWLLALCVFALRLKNEVSN